MSAKVCCVLCATTESVFWHRVNGDVLCNACSKRPETNAGNRKGRQSLKRGHWRKANAKSDPPPAASIITRKSSRVLTKTSKGAQFVKTLGGRRSRRTMTFKVQPPKPSSSIRGSISTRRSIYHKGLYYQVGDIVSVTDFSSEIYYAQIRGFLLDSYSNRSAFLQWLVPTTAARSKFFEANHYILGPSDDTPRDMDCLQFICHAPSSYYLDRSTPYPTLPTDIGPNSGDYVLTRFGERGNSPPTADQIFGSSSS